MANKTYFYPKGGLPSQNHIASDRSVFKTAYAVIPQTVMKDIVVIDLETSGVDLKTSEILGVSAVLLKSNKVTGLKYETWCNASQPMNKNALSLIGKKEAFFEDCLLYTSPSPRD